MTQRRPLHRGPNRTCAGCDEDLYFSGCSALTCDGTGCPDCGDGCDLDFDPDGACQREIDEHEHGTDCERMATDKWLSGDEQVYRCECGELYVENHIDTESRDLTPEEKKRLLREQMGDLDVSAL